MSSSTQIWRQRGIRYDLLGEHLGLFVVRHRLWGFQFHLRIERLVRDEIANFDLVPEVPRVSSPQLANTQWWRCISHFHLHQLHRASSHFSRVLRAWSIERVYASVAIYDASIAWCIARSCAWLLQQDAEKALQACAG